MSFGIPEEEGYLRPRASPVIKKYEDLANELHNIRSRIEREIKPQVDKIIALRKDASPSIKDEVPDLPSILPGLIEVIEGLKAEMARPTNDLDALEESINGSKVKIEEIRKKMEELENLLKKPLYAYIATKYLEYLGLANVLVHLESLNNEEAVRIRDLLNGLIAEMADDKYGQFKGAIKDIFSSVGKNPFNSDDLKLLPRYALDMLSLLDTSSKKANRFGVDIMVQLLSRVNNFSAFSKVKEQRKDLVDKVGDISKGLTDLAGLFSIGVQVLYEALTRSMDVSPFAGIDDVKKKLEQMEQNISLISQMRKAQKSLTEALKELSGGSVDGLEGYFKKEYEHYRGVLEGFKRCYDNVLPKDAESIAKCIDEGGCFDQCPKDIVNEVSKELRDRVDRLSQILKSDRVIADGYCEDKDVISSIDELSGKVNSKYDLGDVSSYYKYIILVDKISKSVIECIKNKGSGNIQIDITGLDTDTIKSLVEVLRTRNASVFIVTK